MSKLRIATEDFPGPTAVAVPWPDAGVVLFVDVCRSTFETAAPSVWVLSTPSPEAHQQQLAQDVDDDFEAAAPTHATMTALPVSPASVTFRCTSLVPQIIGNVLVLFMGDASVSAASSSGTAGGAAGRSASPTVMGSHGGSANSSSPSLFFGVCASMLPPPSFVRRYGAGAFASFAFAWLCGSDVQAMRPAPRTAFACCVADPVNPVRSQTGVVPSVSVWVHGGFPFVSRAHAQRQQQQTMGTTNGAAAAGVSRSPMRSSPHHHHFEPLAVHPDPDDEASDAFVVAADSEHLLRGAVDEDFYSVYELRLRVTDDTVSVWPWARRQGLPVLASHSLCVAASTVSGATPSAAAAAQPKSWQRGSGGVVSSSLTQQQRTPLYLVAFGGLCLTTCRCRRSDLLPIRNTEFCVSNTFYVYDVAADSWEWRDSLTGTDLDGTEPATDGAVAVVGQRPPPVFGHTVATYRIAGYSATARAAAASASADDEYDNGGHDDALTVPEVRTTHCIVGGLRGRFSEPSREMWCYSPRLPLGIDCCPQTGPPCAPTHVFSCEPPAPTSTTATSAAASSGGQWPTLWAMEARSRRLWHRPASVAESGLPWQGPVQVNSGAAGLRRGRSIDLDNPAPIVVHIPAGAPRQTKQQQQELGAAGDPRRAQSPNTEAFVMDAFEF